jgi:hypothetical protein
MTGYTAYGFSKLYKYRNVFPIAQRQPLLLLISNLIGFAACFNTILATMEKDHINCFGYFFTASVFTTVFVVTFTARVILLWYLVLFTQHALEFNEKQDEAQRTLILSAGQYAKRYRIIFVILSFLIMCAVIGPVISSFVTTPGSFESNMRTRACVDVYLKGFGKSIAVNFCLLVIVFALYWRVRKFEDNFLIRKEFSNMGRACVCLFLFFVLFMIPPLSTFSGNVLNLTSIGFGLLNMFYVKFSIVDMYKIAKSQKVLLKADLETEAGSLNVTGTAGKDVSLRTSEEISPKREAKRYKELLKLTLANDRFSQQLKDFLIKECAVENYLFLKAVESIKENPRNSNLVKKVLEDFCQSDSPLCINISHDTRKKLQMSVNVTGDMARDTFRTSDDDILEAFETAYKEIFRLLLADSFVRFVALTKFDQQINLDVEMEDGIDRCNPPSPAALALPTELDTNIETKATTVIA